MTGVEDMEQITARRMGLAGAVCTLAGVGMARFGYTPLIPALVDAGWFSTYAANYLGALNLLGYLIGAVLAHRATLVFGVRRVLAACLILTAASFYGCALDWGALWYGVWRLTCGISGAMLVVIGAPAALARVRPTERAGTGALVFTGIGMGIVASGTLVPWLMTWGIAVTWLALAALVTLLAAWSWWAVWRHLTPLATESGSHVGAKPPLVTIVLIMLAYGLDAAGFVPHTVFWVDYIAHQLGRGIAAGSGYWTLFGVGAVCGPFMAGRLSQALGPRMALTVALAVKLVGVLLPLVSSAVWALAASSLLVGAMVPATVSLTSGSIAALTIVARQQQFWGWATVSFALMQAVAAYGLSRAYSILNNYQPLFAVAAVALMVAVILAAVAAKRPGAPAGSTWHHDG